MNAQDRQSAFDSYVQRCEDVVLHNYPLASLVKRECGACTLCCHAPAIDQSQLTSREAELLPPKPAGEACRHCTSKGCSIYQSRPGICKGYLCLYAVGLIDTFPMDGKVCWTLQPCLQTELVIVVGHCNDVDEVMRDVDNRADMRAFMSLTGMHRPGAVVLRSPTKVARFDNTGRWPDLMADVDQRDPMKMEVIDETQRRARWSLR